LEEKNTGLDENRLKKGRKNGCYEQMKKSPTNCDHTYLEKKD